MGVSQYPYSFFEKRGDNKMKRNCNRNTALDGYILKKSDKIISASVHTQIRLLLKEQSDQGLHCLAIPQTIYVPQPVGRVTYFIVDLFGISIGIGIGVGMTLSCLHNTL